MEKGTKVVQGPTVKEEIILGRKIGERIAGEVKKEWFSVANLHKASNATHDEVKNMLGHLQAFGMLKKKMTEDGNSILYKVVTTKEERDDIMREGIGMMESEISRLQYACKRLNNIVEINPWEGEDLKILPS